MSAHNRIDPPSDGLRVEPEQITTGIDEIVARSTEALASMTVSRRSFLALLGKFALGLVGAELIRVLPIDREVQIAEATAGNCNDWYMCGIYADRVCQCACGSNSCPSTERCPTYTIDYWIGCCSNGSSYYEVRYYDCCTSGCKPSCCSTSGCQCYKASPANWCYPYPLSTLCCTRWAIYPGC